MRRLALVAVLVLAVQLVLAQPAHAANNMVYVTGTILHIDGQLYPMHATVRMAGGSFVVDNNTGILAGSGCAHGADVTVVVCAGPVTYAEYRGNPNRDFMDYWTAVPAELRGEGGDDELWGGDGADIIVGGPGQDVIHGWDGADQLFGESGHDQLFGENGADAIEGDAGNDVLSGGAEVDCALYKDHTSPVTADLDGAIGDDGSAGEADTIVSDVECLIGGDGNDHLIGNNAENLIEGGNGADVLLGLGGSDKLAGEGSLADPGGFGADWLLGGDADDWLIGDDGDDQLFGESGLDALEGAAGFDHCDLGPGGGTTATCES